MKHFYIWTAIMVGVGLACAINLPFSPYFWYWLGITYLGVIGIIVYFLIKNKNMFGK